MDHLSNVGIAAENLRRSRPKDQHIDLRGRVLKTQLMQQGGRHERVANAGQGKDEDALHRPDTVWSPAGLHKAGKLPRRIHIGNTGA